MKSFFFSVAFLLLAVIAKAQVVPVDDVSGYLGKTVTVYGKIEDGRFLLSAANQPTLLNMGGKFPNQKLTVVIYGTNRPNFGYKPEELLINKVVYVTGKVELYKNKPQVVVQNPFEIAFSAPSSTTSPMAGPGKKQEASPKLSKRERREQEKQIQEVEKANKEAMERAAKTPTKTPERPMPVLSKPEVKPQQEKPVVQSKVVQTRQPEIVLNSELALRGGPGTNFNIIGYFKKGTPVRIVSSSYGWAKIMERNATDESRAMAGYVREEKLH